MLSEKSLNIIEIPAVQKKINIHKRFIFTIYRKYFKKIVPIAKLVKFLNVKLIPYIVVYKNIWTGSSSKRFAFRQRIIIKQNEFVRNHCLNIKYLFKETTVKAITPDVYPIEDIKNLIHPQGEFMHPSVYISAVNNAEIYGGSNLVFHKDMAIYHDLYDFNHDYTSEELHRYMQIHPKQNKLRVLSYDKNYVEVKSAATFLDATSNNYAHWLSEVLPRIALFCTKNEYKNIPIIINQGLHKNILDSLSFILDDNRVVYTLPRGRMIKAETLYLTSATGYVPFDTRPHKDSIHRHDGIFSPEAIKLMRDKILKHIEKIKNDKALPKKVLVMRNSTARGVQNIIELKEILMADGFEIVEPEKLSFIEQVQVFNNADHIVAPTGAALGSAIFCSSSAKVTVMMGKHKNMIYRYWAEMLQSVGVKLSYLLGEIVGDKTLGIHGDYIIDKKDLISLLENAENK